MSLVALLTLATAAPIEASWNLEEGTTHRWMMETEVAFPGHVWLFADRNRDIRAHTLGIQARVDCAVSDTKGRAATLDCVLEDAAVTGSTFASERGRLQPVLEELDAKLTGAPLTVSLTPDGRVRNIDFVANKVSPFENRRTRETDAFLRMMVVRALAPIDLAIPKDGFPVDSWTDANTLTLAMPITSGTAGKGRIAHVAAKHDDTRVLVRSAGRATIVPSGFLTSGALILDAELEGHTVFDLQTGRVSEAAWTTWAEPTASSGPLARPYSSVNRLRALQPGEAAPVSATFEWTTPASPGLPQS